MKKCKTCTCYSNWCPITVANDTIETLPLVADKTIKDLSNQKKQYTC